MSKPQGQEGALGPAGVPMRETAPPAYTASGDPSSPSPNHAAGIAPLSVARAEGLEHIPGAAPSGAGLQPGSPYYPPGDTYHQPEQASHPPFTPQSQQAVSFANPIQNQPLAREAMLAVRPNPLDKSLDEKGEREWNHGFWGCFDRCGTCCVAYWCPCIVYGKNHSRLRALKDTGKPHPQGGESCSGHCWASCLVWGFTGLGCIFQIIQRGDVRYRYGIRGNGCYDCMAASCCGPCQLTQETREIEDEEAMTRRQITPFGL